MEQQLKQRLTGAVVLISLAVIFIPVILEGPRDEWTPRDHTIPEAPALDYSAPTELPLPVPLDEPPTEQAGIKADDRALPAAVPVPPPATEPVAAKPVVQAAPPSPAKPAAAPVRKQSLANGWYVQVGSFSQSDNARRLRDQLRADGHDAHLQSIGKDKGDGYRVLVGPSRTRTLAEKLQHKLAGAHKMKGIVIEISGSGG